MINAGSGLTWSVSNAAISLHGDWHYEYGWGIVNIKDAGDFEGDVSDVSVSVSVTLGVDETGRPTIATSGCSSQLGNINITVNGGASWLYTFLINNVMHLVRGNLETLVCVSACQAIDENASRELSTLPVQVGNEHTNKYNFFVFV